MASLSFAALPCDLCQMIVREWLPDARTISDLDVAFCNRAIRPQFLRWINGLDIPSPYSVEKETEVVVNQTGFLYWLKTRHLFLSTVHIHNLALYRMAIVGGRALSKARSCVIDSAYVNEDTQHIMKSFPRLESLTLRSFMTSIELLLPWKALPRPELLISLQITCQSFWSLASSEQQLHIDLPSLTSLHISCQDYAVADLVHLCSGMSHLRALYVDGGYIREDDSDSEALWCYYPVLVQITKLTLRFVAEAANCFLLDRSPSVTDLDLRVTRDSVRVQTAKDIFSVYLPRLANTLQKLTYQDVRLNYMITARAGDGGTVFPFVEDIESMQSAVQTIESKEDLLLILLRSLQRAPLEHLAVYTSTIVDSFRHGKLSTTITDQLGQMSHLTHVQIENIVCPATPQSLLNIFAIPYLQCIVLNNVGFVGDAFSQCLQLCVDQGVCAQTVSSFVFKQYQLDIADMQSAQQLLPTVLPNVKKLELSFASFSKGDLLHLVGHLPRLQLFEIHEDGKLTGFLRTMSVSDWHDVARISRCRRWEVSPKRVYWPGLKRMIDGLNMRLNLVLDKDDLVEWPAPVCGIEEMQTYMRQRRLVLVPSLSPIC